jgi:hypothetical protein
MMAMIACVRWLLLLQLLAVKMHSAAVRRSSETEPRPVPKDVEEVLSPEVASLVADSVPSWARQIPALNYTVAFLHLVAPLDTKACSMQLELFDGECGMCRRDCSLLVRTAVRTGRFTSDRSAADLIVVSPEMGRLPNAPRDKTSPFSENNLTEAVFRLPRRPEGKYYVIRKHRAAVNYICDKRLLPMGTDPVEQAVPGANLKCKYFCDVLFRRDIIWANYDLSEHNILDDTLPGKIRGITLPSGIYYYRGKVHPLEQRFGANDIAKLAWEKALEKAQRKLEDQAATKQRHDSQSPLRPPLLPQEKYLAWFRGKCHDGAEDSSHVRFQLALAFQV